MTRNTLAASLLLLAGAAVLSPAPTYAQKGKNGGGRADRQNQILSGRIVRGTVQNMVFGDHPSLVVKTDEGETLTLNWLNAKFHNDGADASPSSFAVKNPAGSVIAILYAEAQGSASLREAWDLASWNAELNKHKGVQTGGVSSLNNRVIQLGEFRYALSKDTLWVKGGQSVKRTEFSVRQTVFVKGDTSSGVPVALTVADTAEGANMSGLDVSKAGLTDGFTPKVKGGGRPPSSGSGKGKRPKSSGTGAPATGDGDGLSPTEEARQNTGNSRPPSSGSGNATSYTVRMFLKITDSTDANDAAPKPINGLLNKLDVQDEKVECFGDMRANGQLVWKIEKEDADNYKKRTGETVTILPTEASGMRNGSAWRVTPPSLALSGNLYDKDATSNADLLYGWTLNLNLASLAGAGEKVYKSSGGKAELHVVVTR